MLNCFYSLGVEKCRAVNQVWLWETKARYVFKYFREKMLIVFFFRRESGLLEDKQAHGSPIPYQDIYGTTTKEASISLASAFPSRMNTHSAIRRLSIF